MITGEAVLHDIESRVYQAVCQAHGERMALACVRALATCLYLNFKARLIYIPTGYHADAEQRFDAIWADFTGRNHAELSIKYRISLQRVYEIVKFMRKAALQTRQADLFPHDEPESNKPLILAVLHDYLPAELRRVGLPQHEAENLAADLGRHLIATYPGIQFCVSAAMWQKRQGGNGDLFADIA